MLTYRNKVLSEVKAILGDLDSYEPESLSHRNKVMEIFVDAGVEDTEFNACREQLITKCSRLSIDGLKPEDVDATEKGLREVLNSLSAHRSRLSNIKWSIPKVAPNGTSASRNPSHEKVKKHKDLKRAGFGFSVVCDLS